MKTDAEYRAIAHEHADKEGLGKHAVWRGEFISTFVACEKIFDAAAERRARLGRG